ncbi:MAG: ATP-binding protein [Chromatiales bacterium]
MSSPFRILRTLKLQITLALLTVMLVFGLAHYFTSMALQKQRDSNILLSLAGRLQLTSEQLATQGMNYKENAPRDYETYHRDVRLYYRDLMSHVMAFDQISEAFMHGSFDTDLTGIPGMVEPELSEETYAAVDDLQAVWKDYRSGLEAALGPDQDEPRLEYAAEYVIEHHDRLQSATDGLMNAYQAQVSRELALINLINRGAWLAGVAMTLGIIIWFYVRVLGPLDRAVAGFRRVARGDFGHQVQSFGDNELAWMTESFNRLSSRLDAFFRLIDRIQRGSDLEDALRFVAEEFPALLPLDWVGVLFVTGDGNSIKLERAYLDGRPRLVPHAHFSLAGTLLEKAMQSGEPLHIPDVPGTAASDDRYRFLRLLVRSGARDAIFLPVTEQSPLPGVLVFAARKAHAYTREHLELLTNIAGLVTHTFGRTVKLAEHARLAAIGQFASGIAHEVRSPLGTISLALDYFCRSDLPAPAAKRAALAREEAERVARILEDMLLYAKPLTLDLQVLDLGALVDELIQTHQDLASGRSQRLETAGEVGPAPVLGDRDRLFQVLRNLTRNACEAAPDGSVIHFVLALHRGQGTVSLSIRNPGDPIAPEVLDRLMEPFFTTKANGTGLGLAIVKRLVDAQGGEVRFESDREQGTRAILTLPLAD